MTRGIIAITVAIAALLGVLMGGVAARALPNGVRFYAVESGSMFPFMRPGDLVVDVPTTSATAYSVGDVVTFHPTPDVTITHRIAAIGAEGIHTKGDANRTEDVGQIPLTSVVGREVAVVPFLGYVATFLRQPVGIAALVLVMVFLYLAWDFAGRRSSGSGAASDLAVLKAPSREPQWPDPAARDRQWPSSRERGTR